MKVEDVKKIGIVGCGTMGPTIAATTAIKYETVVKEVNKKLAEQGFKRIKDCFPALVRRNAITEVQRELAISQITMTTELESLKDCQVIIDAVPDDLDMKLSILSQLNQICPQETVFTTTSSIMSISALASGSGRPDRFIGTHYCNPAHLMALVEVAPAVQTSEETIEFTMEFLSKGLGKMPIKCKDWPGFIVNFLFFPFLVQAVKALELGLGATVEDIDTAAKSGLGHPMGPFELMDMFSLDSCMVSFPAIYEQLHDEKFAPPPLLRKMCEAGYVGRKVGKGWYQYDEKGKKIGPTRLP